MHKKDLKVMEKQSKMNWLWMTAPMAVLLTIAAGGGFFLENIYHDTPSFIAQAVAQDFVNLFISLPVLGISAILAYRGSKRAFIIWLGMVIYLIYTYVVAAFSVRFNAMFLVYVALLGSSIYTLIGSLATENMEDIKSSFSDKTPTKVISITLIVYSILFYMLWLSELIPALLAGEIPASVLEVDLPTNSIHVLDMAWILPGMIISAILLRKNEPLGYTTAGALLTFVTLEVLAILAMVVFMTAEGHPIVLPQVIIFGVIMLVNLGMATWYLKELKS